MNIGEFIFFKRKELGLTLEEIGNAVGVSKSTVKKWETGFISNMKRDKIALLAEVLHVSPAELISENIDETRSSFDIFSLPNIVPLPKMKKVPRLGKISCGVPIMAVENFDGYDNVPDNIQCDFSLVCDGDSMINARINSGDIVYIRRQSIVDNGEIAAVMVNGETTLKRIYLYKNKVVLQAENPKYEPWVYVNEELDNIQILGKAVGFTSVIR